MTRWGTIALALGTIMFLCACAKKVDLPATPPPPAPTAASDDGKLSLGEVAESAVRQSKLTLPGSTPFHLKAEIVETTNLSSEYQANVEEYWISPQKWRRTIESPGLSQTLIVNEDQVSEKNTGDYFPWWLNDLVTAMVDPLPMLDQLKQLNLQIAKPGPEHPNSCADIKTKSDRSLFCFEGSHGLLTSVFTPRGYEAEFEDFRDFKNKHVARLILIDPEPGTTIQARITELTELRQEDEALFAVSEATPARDRIKTVKVDEATVRGLALSDTQIAWPPVGGGPLTGGCGVYVSVDRAGQVREVWPEGCDNPGLQDPLREMVKKWRLKPTLENGVAVQIEARMTFAFETKLVNDTPAPKVSDAEAPKAATTPAQPHTQLKGPPVVLPSIIKMVKPDCDVGQSCNGIHGDVVVIVDVLADGTIGDVTARSGDPRLFDVAIEAASCCTFQPGTFLGKPTSMNLDLKYRF
jgi:Gram-negative bacterial TonB protein C-terminal